MEYPDIPGRFIVRAAQNLHYGIHRNTTTHTETYVRWERRVEVRYDESFQDVEAVKVILPATGGAYPATIAGAVAALPLPYEG